MGTKFQLIGCIDWQSSKDMMKAARYVQTKMIQELGLWDHLPRFRLVQLGKIPSQKEILAGLARGMYMEMF